MTFRLRQALCHYAKSDPAHPRYAHPMKRVVLFVIVGPLIGLLPIVALAGLPAFNGLPMLLGAAYLAGAVPALLTGLVDWRAARLSRGKRALVSAAAGFVLSAAIPWVLNHEFVYFLLVGLFGAIAAAVCSLLASWLSGKFWLSARAL